METTRPTPMLAAAAMLAASQGLAASFGMLKRRLDYFDVVTRRSDKQRRRRINVKSRRAANVRRMQRARRS